MDELRVWHVVVPTEGGIKGVHCAHEQEGGRVRIFGVQSARGNAVGQQRADGFDQGVVRVLVAGRLRGVADVAEQHLVELVFGLKAGEAGIQPGRPV